MDLNTIFDGIGTEIISIIINLVIGAIGGGAVGYRIGVKRAFKQKQIVGDDSKQRQELRVENMDDLSGSTRKNEKTNQYQRAGKKSEQVQIAGVSTQTHDKADDVGDG